MATSCTHIFVSIIIASKWYLADNHLWKFFYFFIAISLSRPILLYMIVYAKGLTQSVDRKSLINDIEHAIKLLSFYSPVESCSCRIR